MKCSSCPHLAAIERGEYNSKPWEETPCAKCDLGEDTFFSIPFVEEDPQLPGGGDPGPAMSDYTARSAMPSYDSLGGLLPVPVITSIIKGLLSLDPALRDIVSMRFQGYTYREIAEHQGTSVHSFFRTKDYDRMKARVAEVIRNAEDKNSPFNPHPENCEYCGFKAECPALASKALAVATQYSDELQLPDEMHPSNITDPKQMALALKLAPVLTDWAQSVRKHALDMVQGGQEIPGYGLKFRSGQRTIKDIPLVWEIIQQEFAVPLHEFLPACSISVSALEKAVKDQQERGKGAAAIRRMNQLLTAEGLCTTGDEVCYLAKER
jgi:hypothetical protein